MLSAILRYMKNFVLLLLIPVAFSSACKKDNASHSFSSNLLSTVDHALRPGELVKRDQFFYDDKSRLQENRHILVIASNDTIGNIHRYFYTTDRSIMKKRFSLSNQEAPGYAYFTMNDKGYVATINFLNMSTLQDLSEYEYTSAGYIKMVRKYMDGAVKYETEYHYGQHNRLDSQSQCNVSMNGKREKVLAIVYEYEAG